MCVNEVSETSSLRYNIGLVLPVLFYTAVGLINLFTYKLAKQGVNALFKQLLRSSSYSSSLRVILVLKFCNTLIIDYQPGSVCAGQLFADQYNTKLAFFQAFNEPTEFKVRKLFDQQAVQVQEAQNRANRSLYKTDCANTKDLRTWEKCDRDASN